MSKIIEYYAVHDDNAEMLTEKVNEMIKQGWQPFGSLAVSQVSSIIHYSQPMVQYGELTD